SIPSCGICGKSQCRNGSTKRDECCCECVSLEKEKISVIHSSTGSQYLRNTRMKKFPVSDLWFQGLKIPTQNLKAAPAYGKQKLLDEKIIFDFGRAVDGDCSA